MMHKILILILFVMAFNCHAQTNNFWVQDNKFGVNSSFYFDEEGVFKILKNFSTNKTHSSYGISDFSGKPKLYKSYDIFSTDGVFNISNHLVENSENIKNVSINYNNAPILIDTQNYLFVGGGFNIDNGENMYFTIVQADSSLAGYSVKEEYKNMSLRIPNQIRLISLCRNKYSEPVFIVKTTKMLYSVLFRNKKPILLDSFERKISDYVLDSFKNNPMYVLKDFAFGNLMCSNNGEYISFSDKYYVESAIGGRSIFESERLNIIKFNSLTGAFGKLTKIMESSSELLVKKNPYLNFSYEKFSPNDSFLYFYTTKVNAVSKEVTNDYIFQYDIANEKSNIIQTNSFSGNFVTGSYLFLNHKGVLFYISTKKSGAKNESFYNSISEPNKPFPLCQLKTNQFKFEPNFTLNNQTNYHVYDYLRTSYKIDYTCTKAVVNFKNQSQSWIKFSKYKWHYQNDKDEELFFEGTNPPALEYHKNGDYYVKIFGESDFGNGYGEWRIDTIKIRIPEKPIPLFSVKDSVVCRYTGVDFSNHSTSKNGTIKDYKWIFGDGSSSTEEMPNHIYKNIGVYSVSLKYSNGFCDSIFSKLRYIRVLDAPAPGFQINTKSGCASLNIKITDTVERDVKQKDYYFEHLNKWVNLSLKTTEIYETINKAGVYKIIQRLTGYYGCVTQTDSVFVNVSKGLSEKDLLNVEVATILHYDTSINNVMNNKLGLGNALVKWNTQSGAVKYQIYKNNSPYAFSKDTFFIDKDFYLKDAEYSVKGIDSCGHFGGIGKIGKPVFLKAEIVGNNEAAIISFSPYLDYHNELPFYAVQKNDPSNSKWINVANYYEPKQYLDYNYLEENQQKACFRIAVGEKDGIYCYSNIVCIPYVPMLFLPTAFSPNGDGINDEYIPKFWGVLSFQLEVYNRWGELVFSGATNEGWKGENINNGEFIVNVSYVLNSGVKKYKKTSVSLLK